LPCLCNPQGAYKSTHKEEHTDSQVMVGAARPAAQWLHPEYARILAFFQFQYFCCHELDSESIQILNFRVVQPDYIQRTLGFSRGSRISISVCIYVSLRVRRLRC
jgi:hypothetical protein